MKELSIIIVNYNVRYYIQQALHSICRAVKNIDAEIIVVDNGSGDGSVQLIKREFPSVKLIRNKENAGFAKANNQAIKIAKGKIVALVNPDTLVREDTFNVCLNYLNSHDDVGAVGCKILNPDGSLQLACRRSFPSPWVAFTKIAGLNALFPKSRLFGRYNLTYLDPDKAAEVEAISGSFMVVKKEAIDQAGMLDERFFMYGEDLDWCYRINSAGWKIVYLPDTEIIHYKGQSALEAPFDNLLVFNKAMLLFVKKHMKPGLSLLPQWILILGIWIRSVVSVTVKFISRHFPVIVDFLLLSVSMVISILIRFSPAGRAGDYFSAYKYIIPVYSLLWLLCLAGTSLYRRRSYNISRTIAGVLTGLILNTSLTFFFPQFAYSRQVVLVSALLNLFLLTGWRVILRFLPNVERVPFLKDTVLSFVKKRVVVAGTGKKSREIITKIENRIKKNVKVVGIIAVTEDDFNIPDKEEFPVLGTVYEINRLVKVHKINEIIIPPDVLSYKQILSVVADTRNLNVDIKMVAREMDVLIGRSVVESIDEISFVDIEYKIYFWYNRFLKRMFDLILSLLLLPFSLAVHVYTTLSPDYTIIKTVLKRPAKDVYLKQLSCNGKKNSVIVETLFYILYVFSGKMSFVGIEPDPDATVHTVWFKPGLTTLYRVSEDLSGSAESKQRYNYYYLRNYSLLMDLEILIKSIIP